jgi:hypothetical protein
MHNFLILSLLNLLPGLVILVVIIAAESWPKVMEPVFRVIGWIGLIAANALGLMFALACIAVPMLIILILTGNWPPSY